MKLPCDCKVFACRVPSITTKNIPKLKIISIQESVACIIQHISTPFLTTTLKTLQQAPSYFNNHKKFIIIATKKDSNTINWDIKKTKRKRKLLKSTLPKLIIQLKLYYADFLFTTIILSAYGLK